MFPLTPDQHHWLEVATEDEDGVDGRPVSIARQHGTCWRARVSTSEVDEPVNSASGNRALLQTDYGAMKMNITWVGRLLAVSFIVCYYYYYYYYY